MKIGISLNEVLRDFLGGLAYNYEKFVGPCNVKEGDVKSLNLLEYFPFKDKEELNHFMYSEQALQIFGHPDQMTNHLFTHFNRFIIETIDEEEHTIEVVSKEVTKSIPATLFFLSKNACIAPNIRFVTHEADEWNGLDVLITANPITLAHKPEGKIAVKVKASYNEDAKADFEINALEDFILDASLRNTILNTTIITL